MLSRCLTNNRIQCAIFGDLVKGALGGFAQKPVVPGYVPVDVGAQAAKANTSNLQNLPTLEDIASQVNTFNVGQRQGMLQSAIPGWSNLTGLESSVLGDRLQGKIPINDAAVQGAVSAARAAGGGYAGSGAGLNLSARDLGLMSSGIQEQALRDVPGYLANVGSLALPPEFNVQSGFVSPQQAISTDMFNTTNQWNRDWLANRIASVPDPETAAIAGDVGNMTDFVASAIPYFGAAYSAGLGGGGGSAPGGGGGGGGGMGSLFSQFGGNMGFF